jgi:hypothetical protein
LWKGDAETSSAWQSTNITKRLSTWTHTLSTWTQRLSTWTRFRF